MERLKETAKELWNFFRAAGVLQAVVDGKAFRSLKDLPDENWAVLSCPTAGLNFDAKTISFIDDNNDNVSINLRLNDGVKQNDESLKTIEAGAFNNCGIGAVFYQGSQQDKNNIVIESNNMNVNRVWFDVEGYWNGVDNSHGKGYDGVVQLFFKTL